MVRPCRGSARAATAALATLVGLVVTVLGWPGVALAHATLILTVNDDGRGSVSVDAQWTDGHPIEGPLVVTLVAVGSAAPSPISPASSASAGEGARRIGPVPLTHLAGSPTAVYQGSLPPGEWQVTVDAALPAVGHCVATVRVSAAAGTPGSTRCGEPGAEAVAAPPPAPGTDWRPWILVVVVLLGGVLILVTVRRRAARKLDRGRNRAGGRRE